MSDNSKTRASDRYNRMHTTRVYLTLNNRTDADILDYIKNIDGSVQGYIKALIRADIARQQNESSN